MIGPRVVAERSVYRHISRRHHERATVTLAHRHIHRRRAVHHRPVACQVLKQMRLVRRSNQRHLRTGQCSRRSGNNRSTCYIRSPNLIINAVVGARRGRQRECLRGLVAPYKLHQLRVIDKRITVALQTLHSVVAHFLFLAHRVVAVPIQQQTQRPRLNSGIGGAVANKHRVLRGLPAQFLLVGANHIEIGPRKITFVHVCRFKHLRRAAKPTTQTLRHVPYVAARVLRRHIGLALISACTGRKTAGHTTNRVAQRIVLLGVVGRAVRREQVMQVGVSDRIAALAAKPTIRHAVLAVDTARLAVVVVLIELREPAHPRIHVVHQFAVIARIRTGYGVHRRQVRRLICLPQAVITDLGVRVHDTLQRQLQRLTVLSVKRRSRIICGLRLCHYRHRQLGQTKKKYPSLHTILFRFASTWA